MCKTTTPSAIFLTANAGRPVLKPFLGLGLGCTIPKASNVESKPIAAVEKRETVEDKNVPEQKYSSGRWTKKEHEMFLEGLKELGKNWREISMIMKTRSPVQVRTHAQKFFLKMARAEKALNGGQKEIGLEYTSLKKHTKVMSACLADVKSQPEKFEYEIMLPGTVPAPAPVKAEKKEEKNLQEKQQVENIPVKNEDQEPRVKSEDLPGNDPDPVVLWTPESEAPVVAPRNMGDDKGDHIAKWMDLEAHGYSSDSSSSGHDGDTYSLSSDYDSSALEDVLFNDVPEGCMYDRLPRKNQEIIARDPLFELDHVIELEESDLSEIDDNLFEMEGPQLPVPFKRKNNCLGVEEGRISTSGANLWKRPRAVLDTELPCW